MGGGERDNVGAATGLPTPIAPGRWSQPWRAFAVGVALMAIVEAIKRFAWPGISIWESHVATALAAGSVTAMFAAYTANRARRAFERQAEENRRMRAARDSEIAARAKGLADAAFEGLVISENGKVLLVNERIVEMFGYEVDALIGQSAMVMVAPESQQLVLERMRAGTLGRYQHVAMHRNGRRIDVEVQARPMEYQGRTVRATAVRDITAQKAADAERTKLVEILETTTDLVGTCDVDGRAIYINKAGRDLLGLAAGDSGVGTPVTAFHPPDVGRLIVDTALPTAARSGAWHGATALQSKSGAVIPGLQVVLAHRDGSGAVAYYSTIFRDTRELERVAQALRDSETRYRRLVEVAPEAIVVLDVDAGRFIDVNARAAELFAMSREALLQVGPVDVSPKAQPDGRPSADKAQELIGQTLVGQMPVFDWIHCDANGRQIECEIRLVRFPPDDRRLVRGSITDVTERRRLESHVAQLQRGEIIGRLAGGVAHDFNNLLTAILAFATVAKKGVPDGSGPATAMDEVVAAARRGGALTEQLLSFARRKIIKPEVADLNRVVHGVDGMLRRLIGEHIELDVKLGAKSLAVFVDVGSLEQVIVNLVVNARDAMSGGGRVIIETTQVQLDAAYAAAQPEVKAGRYVMLSVSDAGHGIPRDVLPHIFEPFFTTRAAGRGTGLGLATCHGIVKQAGGHIAVYSEVGKGTVFKVYLPESGTQATASDEVKEWSAPQVTEAVILFVEDDPMVRRSVQKVLGLLGYRVIVADGGEDALRQVEDVQHIDLLLTDVVMPKMNGVELAKRIIAKFPRIKVLYASGYTGNAIVSQGMLEPGVEFIQKPYSPQAIADRIREVLSGARSA